jgi:hypothetical protein
MQFNELLSAIAGDWAVMNLIDHNIRVAERWTLRGSAAEAHEVSHRHWASVQWTCLALGPNVTASRSGGQRSPRRACLQSASRQPNLRPRTGQNRRVPAQPIRHREGKRVRERPNRTPLRSASVARIEQLDKAATAGIGKLTFVDAHPAVEVISTASGIPGEPP